MAEASEDSRDKGLSVSAGVQVDRVTAPIPLVACIVIGGIGLSGGLLYVMCIFQANAGFAAVLLACAMIVFVISIGAGCVLLVRHRRNLLDNKSYVILSEREAAALGQKVDSAKANAVEEIGSDVGRRLAENLLVNSQSSTEPEAKARAIAMTALNDSMGDLIDLGKIEYLKKKLDDAKPVSEVPRGAASGTAGGGDGSPAWVRVDITKREFDFTQQAITEWTSPPLEQEEEEEGTD